MNAILDTGSTRTVFPAGIDELVGIQRPQDRHRIGGLGSGAEAVSLVLDLSIVDASFPSISCWEFSNFSAEMVTTAEDLDHPVLGWDLLSAFELVISAEDARIELRPTKALLRGHTGRQVP